MRHGTLLVAGIFGIVAWGCDAGSSADTQAQGPTRADSVSMALQTFDEAAFDTISWESDEARSARGSLVFRISCSKCHGLHGGGDGGFVLAGDTLRPPSFLAEEWRLADAPMELRRYIFSGNVAGMPYWGLVGLKYKDIDAVAYFIETPLRAGIGG